MGHNKNDTCDQKFVRRAWIHLICTFQFQECYSLVDRYLRKLDEELLKFKCELEADNRGITEILEKQSLEMDSVPSSTQSTSKENRQPKKHKKQNSMDFSLFPSIANDPSFGTSAATSFAPNFG